MTQVYLMKSQVYLASQRLFLINKKEEEESQPRPWTAAL
jgi:hypothetical protein